MKKFLYAVIGILIVPLLAAFLFISYGCIVSPPSGGQEFSEKLGIKYPSLIAHRGASYLSPEETIPSYLFACELGVDYLELDLQRTKDDVLIALHDDTLERTTDILKIYPERKRMSVENFTYKELLKLDAGSWFNQSNPDRARKSFSNLRIMKLDDIITIAEESSNRPGLYIETKRASQFPGIEEQLVEMLQSRNWLDSNGDPIVVSNSNNSSLNVKVGFTRGRLIFQSFDAESIIALKKLAPGVPRIYLIENDTDEYKDWDKFVSKAKNISHGIGPIGYLAWPWYTGPAHDANLIVHHYVINEVWQMHLVRQFGSDGFFTDRPELAIVHFDRKNSVDIEGIFKKIGYEK